MNQAYQRKEASQASKSINGVILVQTTRVIGVRAQGKAPAPCTPLRAKREHLAFPKPTENKTEATAFQCSAERILALYNKLECKTQQKLTCPVKDWFKETALNEGWNEVVFLENFQTGRIDGCMLLATNAKGSSHAQNH